MMSLVVKENQLPNHHMLQDMESLEKWIDAAQGRFGYIVFSLENKSWQQGLGLKSGTGD